MKLRLATLLCLPLACHYSNEVGRFPPEPEPVADSGTVAVDAGCVPLVCDKAVHACGQFPDGCGGTYDCGACLPSCSNGARDGQESDIDCGGSCKPCAVTAACRATPDCVSTASCIAGVCMQGRWHPRAPMPTPRTGAVAVAVPSGLIYVMGGSRSGGPTNTVEIYSPTADTWSKGPSMLDRRAGFSAVLGADGRIYAIGGTSTTQDAGSALTAEALDLTTHEWTRLENLPQPREHAGSAALPDGRIVVLGGIDWKIDYGRIYDSMAAYSPDAGHWSTLPSLMLNARFDHAVLALGDGRLAAFGGSTSFAELSNRAEVWSPAPPLWSSLPAMPDYRYAFSATKGPDGTAYLLGGYLGQSLALTCDVFHPASGKWSSAAGPTPRQSPAVATAPDGRIWTFGGTANQDYSDLTEVLTP